MFAANLQQRNQLAAKMCVIITAIFVFYFAFVRLKGLEPPRREAPDPKSGVATNYTTAAVCDRKGTK